MELVDLTVAAAARSLRAGEFTAAAYTQALLDRAEARADLNAFITLDPEQTLAAARAADRRRAEGAELGPLHGVPLALKDNIDTSSLATTGGTPALRHHRPARNAPVAQALIEAGALVLGKANLHELAYGVTNNNAAFGAARNPYDPGMIPGGSSGGTAVAVAARMAPGGLGTDTGGSVRIPAALCGIVGFRPSTGRYPRDGIVPISSTRDTAGPMVRTVADAVLMDGVIGGGAVALAPVALEGLRFGVARVPFFEGLDPALERVVAAALERLRGLGVALVEFDAPEIAELSRAGLPIAFHETVTTLTAYLEAGGTGVGLPALFEATASADVNRVLTGLLGDDAVPEEVYREAIDSKLPALRAAIAERFREHRLAALVFPTTPLPARPIGEDRTVEVAGRRVPTFPIYIRNTEPASIAGLPGLSLPIGLTGDGLPVGIELDGPAGGDRGLLSIGLACEAGLEPLPPPM